MKQELIIAACVGLVLLAIAMWNPEVAAVLAAVLAVGLVALYYTRVHTKTGGDPVPAIMKESDAKAAASDIATVKTLTTMAATTDSDLKKIMDDPNTHQMIAAVDSAKTMLAPDQIAAIDSKIQIQTTQLNAMFIKSGLQLAAKSIVGSAVAIGTLGTGESLADLLFLIYSSADLAVGVSRVGKNVLDFVNRPQTLDGFQAAAHQFLSDPRVAAVSSQICLQLQQLVGRLANVLGDMVSMLVPVDPGFLRVGVTSMVLAGSQYAYTGLKSLLERLPTGVLDILLNPSRLEQWLVDVLNASIPDGERGVMATMKGILMAVAASPALMIPIIGPFAWVYLTGNGWAKIIAGTGIDMGRIKMLTDRYIKPRIRSFAKTVSVSANLCLLSLYTASINCSVGSQLPPPAGVSDSAPKLVQHAQ